MPCNQPTLVLLLVWLAAPAAYGFQNTPSTSAEILIRLKQPLSQQAVSKPLSGNPEIAAVDFLATRHKVASASALFHRPLSKTIQSAENVFLRSILKIRLGAGEDAEAAVSFLERHPDVLYAHPNRRLTLDFVPNDPEFVKQWWLQTIRAEEAWDVTTGSAEILIGVIDTGVDHEHEDLGENLWVNEAEDLNGNRRLDPDDLNGVDDDGNGFVDDVIGWDFTDAPGFADGGDFLDPDPDPMDENGHGTAVAGIIAASTNNALGVAGLAFGCRVMVLRAGTSRGFLEEDDVARAIVYAVENGARVINMSFGDTVVSPLLRDVMRFAHERGVVLVASAGNSASEEAHYPSGFDEVIAVGATDPEDRLASFSTRGSWVDLVAPGVDVRTTALGGTYANFSGTSASAPIVSALAGLVLSRQPLLTPEAVRGLLLSTTIDLGELGWDPTFSGGRIDALQAVRVPRAAVARISEPAMDAGLATPRVSIRGTAAGPLLTSYQLEYGVGEAPESWTMIAEANGRQVVNDSLGTWDLATLPDTTYTLRLRVERFGDVAIEDRVRLFVDRTPPMISPLTLTPMIDGAGHSVLVEFETDDLCEASLFWRPLGSEEPFAELPLDFRTTEHRLNVSQEVVSDVIEFYVEAVNRAGLRGREDRDGQLYVADLSRPPVTRLSFFRVAGALPSGYLLPKVADFDADGLPEVLLNAYGADFSFQSLKIFERDGDRFVEVWDSGGIAIPRDWGDSDGDGKMEILAGAGPMSFIFEASGEFGLPLEQTWVDSNDFWAGRFADLDADGRGEILARVGSIWTVWESRGDNRYERVADLANPTDGSNITGVPHAEVGDFDGDRLTEVLLGDLDGDVYLYESQGDDRYRAAWSDRLPLVDAIDFISSGDYDGDGIPEFLAGTHSDPSLDAEHEFDSRHWVFRIYDATGDDRFAAVWEQAFFGFQPPQDFDSGVASGDIDGDGRAEALINIFPDFYIVDFLPEKGYQVVWHDAPNRSNSTLVADLDGDGHNEAWFNDGRQVLGFQAVSTFTGPPTPLGLEARPLGPDVIRLQWQNLAPVQAFRIYRGEDPDGLGLLAETTELWFRDTTVVANRRYWYMVTSLDPGRTPMESLPSRRVSARPGARPYLDGAFFSPPNGFRLRFSEPMAGSARLPIHYWISDIGRPNSAILARSGREVLLSAPSDRLAPGEYEISVFGLEDIDRTPLDSLRSQANVVVPPLGRAPYIVRASLIAPKVIRVEFNEAMDPASAAEASNYELRPTLPIAAAELTQDPAVVRLLLAAAIDLGGSDQNYVLTVRNLRSLSGNLLRVGEGDSAGLLFADLSEQGVRVFPNPWRASDGLDDLTFAGIARDARIHVFTTSGERIATLTMRTNEGELRWTPRDGAGHPLPAGVYIYQVLDGDQKTVGKFAVVR